MKSILITFSCCLAASSLLSQSVDSAQFYYNNHQFQKAIEMVQKCNSCDHKERILGMSYYHLEDYGKAVKFLQQSIAKGDKDAEATYTLGRTYLELGDEKNTILQFQNAIALEPARNSWIYELGLIYYMKNNYKNSLKYFDMAANAGYNKTNDFYENYGFAQLYSGDTENGLKSLNIILERKPNNKELINDIAYAMYETKQYNEALKYFSKLLELNPKDAASLFMAGMTFQKLGQEEKGKKICENAIVMDPSLSKYHQRKMMPSGL